MRVKQLLGTFLTNGIIRTAFLMALTSAPGCTPQELQSILGSSAPSALSNEDVISGLKEALRVSTERSVGKAGATNGFWTNDLIRIPFPQEAIAVKNTLSDLGIERPVQDFERTLNRAAELAAREAVPVFVDAISSLTITDGLAILRGADNAATNFLRERTADGLRVRFMPVVEKATAEVALTSAWRPVATAYNTATILTGARAVEPDLNAYVSQRTMDGLFLLLAEEEKKIRQDPMARSTALLQKVFAQP